MNEAEVWLWPASGWSGGFIVGMGDDDLRALLEEAASGADVGELMRKVCLEATNHV